MKKIYSNNTIIAHRGIHDNIKIPENSLKAFKLALKQNIPIEFDVQLTKDNTPIIIHDYNLKNMTGINKNVNDLTYKEIKKLYLLNTKEKIPTLEETLKLINNKIPLDIEIKCIKNVTKTCKEISKILDTYQGIYTIKSFNPKVINWYKINKPKILRGLLIHHKYNKKILKPILQSKLNIKYCNPNFIAISKKLLQKKKFQKLSKIYPTMIWTINSQEEINKINNSNYIYICNNLPYKKNSKK